MNTPEQQELLHRIFDSLEGEYDSLKLKSAWMAYQLLRFEHQKKITLHFIAGELVVKLT